MPLTFNFELSDQDLSHIQQAIAAAQKAAVGKSDAEITASARALLISANEVQVPDFIRERLNQLDALIAMLGDEAWALPDEDRARVKSAMAYFSEAEDLIPDSIPVLGYLDDAIAIELSVRELKHEIDAYSEFCEYRQEQAASRGLDAAAVGRAGRRPPVGRMDRWSTTDHAGIGAARVRRPSMPPGSGGRAPRP